MRGLCGQVGKWQDQRVASCGPPPIKEVWNRDDPNVRTKKRLPQIVMSADDDAVRDDAMEDAAPGGERIVAEGAWKDALDRVVPCVVVLK